MEMLTKCFTMFNQYINAMLSVAMILHYIIIVSCLQHVNMLTLLMYALCYEVAFCLDHLGLILMPMNLNLGYI